MRYKTGLLLRRIADRIDGGLHRAFTDAQRDADIYDACRKVAEEGAPRPARPTIQLGDDADAVVRLYQQFKRQYGRAARTY